MLKHRKLSVFANFLLIFLFRGTLSNKNRTNLKKNCLFLQRNSNRHSKLGKKRIAMDYSHPNIAKPFGIGHLRSTVIGESINRIMQFSGYKTETVSHELAQTGYVIQGTEIAEYDDY